MTALRRSRRRRTLGAFAAGLLSLGAVPVLGFIAVDALRNSKEGQNAIEDGLPTTEIPATPGVLFATIDDLEEVTTLTVLALAPPVGGNPARGGTAISVPITAEASLSTGETVNVADAYTAGGVEELQAVTEGLLGVTLSATIAADEPTIARLLARATPLQLELPADVHDTTAVGKDLTLFPAGPVELDANDLAALLLARTADDAAADLYARAAAVWTALAARVGDGLAADGSPSPTTVLESTTTAGATAEPSTTADTDDTAGTPATAPAIDPAADPESFVDAFLSGPVGSYRLGAEPASGATTGPERTRVNLAEVNFVMATVLPGAISPSFASITFFVRSPLGDPELTLEAVAMLIFAGANVVLVKEDSTIAIPPNSTLEVVDEADLPDARRFVTPFGTYDEVEPQVRIEGVDAILTLGESYRALLEGAGATATTTPTTVSTTPTTVSGSEG
ncbi:MAG: hypothetical protein AB7Q42_12890 [Acidimicrobiia bacterium]